MIPCGLVALLWWAAVALFEAGASPVLVPVIWLVSLPVLLLAVFVTRSPPSWMKPRWLRIGESAGGPQALEARKLEMTPTQYAVAWAVLVAGTVVWLLLDPSPTVPIALGFVVPVLLVIRPLRAGTPAGARRDGPKRSYTRYG